MGHTGCQIAHCGKLFLAAHFLFQGCHAASGCLFAQAGLPGPLRVVEDKQTGKSHQKRHAHKHGHVGPVLGAGDVKGRDIHAKEDHGHGKLATGKASAHAASAPHAVPWPSSFHVLSVHVASGSVGRSWPSASVWGNGLEVAVHHKASCPLDFHDAPAPLAAGGKLMHGRFRGLAAVNIEDFAYASPVRMGDDGPVGHGDGYEVHIWALRHLLEQKLQPYAHLRAHACAQDVFEGCDKGKALVCQKARQRCLVALHGNECREADHDGQGDKAEKQQYSHGNMRKMLAVEELEEETCPPDVSWQLDPGLGHGHSSFGKTGES